MFHIIFKRNHSLSNLSFVIIVEVLFFPDMHINVHVGIFLISILISIFHSVCAMTVHRRCASKVGNYCGCEENVLALYEEWKGTVCSLEEIGCK